jgi:pyruvate,orthophosphate dikinase
MAGPVDICRLDYLAGTIATAYKGMVNSLVVKDFCMTEEDDTTTLKGTILSMPEGDYFATLMHDGTELAKTALEKGFFKFVVESHTIGRARNLRIDIGQNGRHIGTFLLKRERPDDFFASAIEISEETRGLNLRLLTSSLGDKIGLLQKAEEIVAGILSTKKDWKKLSEEINSFSKDLFWYERQTFYRTYRILSRYSLKASEYADAASREKMITNFLFLIELPLEKEDNRQKLRSLVEIWLDEIGDSPVDLSCRYVHVLETTRSIHEKFDDIDVGPVLKPLLSSVRERISGMASVPAAAVAAIKEGMPGADLKEISKYDEKNKEFSLRKISGSAKLLDEENYDEVMDRIGEIDPKITDDEAMIDDFFSIIAKNLSRESAPHFMEALFSMFPVFSSLSPDARKSAMQHLAGLLKKLIDSGLTETCEDLMKRISETALRSKEDILLDAGVGFTILTAGNEGLLKLYKGMLMQIVIPAPGISGFSTETWAEVANPLHLERLGRFMDIVAMDTSAFREVLVHVICNLFIGGVFIPDDRIFQRRISSYLNSDTFSSTFLLNYLLLGKLPVYFNEVGATGRIRDYTTEIDAWGNDTVLYFLRKQVHVNASNYNIRLVGHIIESWVGNDPELLKGVVPDDVLGKADRELFRRYASVIRPFFGSIRVLEDGQLHLENLLKISEDGLREALENRDITGEIRSKIFYICRIYQEVVGKYSFASGGGGEKETDREMADTLRDCIGRAEGLKEIVTSSEKTEPEESLYFKRHIAFGIPSVMGSYNESKFNALGDLLRQEEKIRVIFESVAADMEKEAALSKDDLRSWISCLILSKDLFDLHELYNFQVEELASIFSANRLRLSQIIDMLRIWQRELIWTVDFFHRTFHGPMMNILRIFPRDEMTEHLKGIGIEGKDFAEKAADVVIRDIMNSVAGILELDGVLNSLLRTLNAHVAAGRDDEFEMGDTEPDGKEFFGLDEIGDNKVMALAPLLGGKAKNLMYLQNLGLRVPSGVVFTALKTAEYEKYTEEKDFLLALRKAVGRIEEQTGSVFGSAENPLFLSVRSGSYISMPGILSSILYCGMNDATLEAFTVMIGDARTAGDSRRRFIEHYGMVALGVEEESFQEIITGFLKKTGKEKREELDAGQLEELAGLYKDMLTSRGLEIPEDVYEQLRMSVKGVYHSWYSEKAFQFRKAMSVSEHWGTAVLIMQMVPGNTEGAGASVFFTRKPFTMEKKIYGDTRESATGDDLVHGRLTNRPISAEQAIEGQKSLEEADPPLFLQHLQLAEKIEGAMKGLPQEVEATYVRRPGGERTIYVLQTRRMEFHRGFTKRFQDVCRMESSVIGRGVGVHGGALSGVATFASSAERIAKIRKETGLPVILLRHSASTDDVSVMPEIDAVITSAGGATSHASVLSQKFDLTAVVGCPDMKIMEDERGRPFAVIGSYIVKEGTFISLDGSTGLVYSGLCMLTKQSPVS